MASGIITPSYKSGFYSPKRGGVAKYPELWRGCIGAWCPALGATGSRLFDQSLYGNHGTLTNMDAATDWVVSGGAGALNYDNSNDHVLISTVNKTAFGSLPSLAAWVRPTASVTTVGIVAVQSALNSGSPWILVQLNSATIRYWLNGGYRITNNLTTGAWFHHAITFDGTTWTSYVNGLVAGTYTGAIGAAAATAFYIGNGFNGYFPGDIDEVRAYSRTLTASEVKLLASRRGIAYERDGQSAAKTTAAAFKAYWSRRQSHIIGGGVS